MCVHRNTKSIRFAFLLWERKCLLNKKRVMDQKHVLNDLLPRESIVEFVSRFDINVRVYYCVFIETIIALI